MGTPKSDVFHFAGLLCVELVTPVVAGTEGYVGKSSANIQFSQADDVAVIYVNGRVERRPDRFVLLGGKGDEVVELELSQVAGIRGIAEVGSGIKYLWQNSAFSKTSGVAEAVAA